MMKSPPTTASICTLLPGLLTALLACLALALLKPLPAEAANPLLRPLSQQTGPILVVNQNDDLLSGDEDGCTADHCTLREAIESINNGVGSEIQFDPGLNGATITLSGPLYVESSVVIDGPGANRITISGTDSFPLFYLLASVGPTGALARSDTLEAAADFAAPAVTLRDLNLTRGKDNGGAGGGAIVNAVDLILERVALYDNSAGPAGGGAITNRYGSLTVIDSLLANNKTTGDGGAIYNESGAVTLKNVTLSGNVANDYGGALAGSDLTGAFLAIYELDSVTITGNRANADGDENGAGGGYYNSGKIRVTNSIVAGNTHMDGAFADDCGGEGPEIWRYTLGGEGCPEVGGAGNLILGAGELAGLTITDVLDTALADNGGPTRTHALVNASPAIDAGECDELGTDQRGEPRPETPGGRCDMGAFERQTSPPAVAFEQATQLLAENAERVTLTVRLSTAGAQPVTVGYAFSGGEATAGADYEATAGSVTITPPATSSEFSVSIIDDAVDEGDETFGVMLQNPTNATLGEPSTVRVTIRDDDTAGVTVNATGSETTEGGGSVTVGYRLASRPTAPVTLRISSSNSAEGAVSPAELTFTTENWSTPQTVTVTGQDDAVDDGDVAYAVRAAIVTEDGAYAELAVDDVVLTNLDDDAAGVTVNATGSETTEGGGSVTVGYRLASRPTAPVTLRISSSNSAEGAVSPAELTFTTENWSTPQTVTVTGQDDAVDDGDVAYAVRAAIVTEDGAYAELAVDDVVLINLDDDEPPLTIAVGSPVGAVTEGGGTATFDVTVGGTPTAAVEIALTVSDPDEVVVAPARLTFAPGVADARQTVTVQGLDDDVDDNSQAVRIDFTVRSADARADNYVLPPITITNQDDDTAGVTVAPAGGRTTEAGGTFVVGIGLESRPTATVIIDLTIGDSSEGTVLPASLRFAPAEWRTTKNATIRGVDDVEDDGDVLYTIRTVAQSADPKYSGIPVTDISVTNGDDDTAEILLSKTSVTTEERGTSDRIVVALASRPTADVTINARLIQKDGEAAEAVLSEPSVTLTADNWLTGATLTVTGQDDAVDDGDADFRIELTVASESESYAELSLPAISGVNLDDDEAAITVSPLAGITDESGAGFAVTIALGSQPTADVTLFLTPDRPGEVLATPSSVTFTPANWMTPQVVALSGIDEAIDDGDRAVNVLLDAASQDPLYADWTLPAIAVVNGDDDEAGVAIEQSGGTTQVQEGGTSDTYTITLLSEPIGPVALAIATDGQIEVSDDGVTFADALTLDLSADPSQTIQVRAVDDAAAEVITRTAVISHTLETDDPAYAEYAELATIDVTVIDDDGVTIAVADAAAPENAGSLEFTVTMNGVADMPITVDYATIDLPFQADAGIDYAAITGTITFPVDGPAVQTIVTPLLNDDVAEADETFGISLTAPAPDTHTIQLTDAGATGAILNDDGTVICPPDNVNWLKACTLVLGADGAGGTLTAAGITNEAVGVTLEQALERAGEVRWYKFPVEPDSRVTVTLTDLPDNYDITLYKDIPATLAALLTPQSTDDLLRLGAEFAPDAFSPDTFSPDTFSPDTFSPDTFSPDTFSPDTFSPDTFSPDTFSPDTFSPDTFSPDAFAPDTFSPDTFSPDTFSPDTFSPDTFSPDTFSPDTFSPDTFSPDAFSSAQTRSLIGISAFDGVISEGIVLNTWENTGDFYIRVRGRNGTFAANAPFTLTVTVTAGSCSSVSAALPPSDLPVNGTNLRTLILVDWVRMQLAPGDQTALEAKLNQLAGRGEVGGAVIDVGQDARVRAANGQADLNPACPFAKNLVAASIETIVDRYRATNPLAYIVLVGNDDVIPFFRYPDQANLANERNYVPPVRDSSASQASLRLGYILTQDRYGSAFELSSKVNALPFPDLPVGRLVETLPEITAVVDAYLQTSDGVVATPESALVTGYDFLEDAALAVERQLAAGLGDEITTLITPREISPADERSWSAGDLRELLLTERHDLVYLAGHFSAGSALAADYRTRLLASEITTSPVDFRNVLVFSGGCHSGYNIVNEHGIPGVSAEPDWAQAFAGKGATLIAGTGYQYGDTDFIEYGERLYEQFAAQLRAGSGPVAVGDALVAAKQDYLAETTELRAIHEKSLLVATLFGLPMLRFDLPAGRNVTDGLSALEIEPSPVLRNPGQTLGLHYADVTVSPESERQRVTLNDANSDATTEASYWRGPDGVVANPTEPVLPKAVYAITPVGTERPVALRGVGLRGGRYEDVPDVWMLTGAATTEIRGVHPIFLSDVFYPIQPWKTNYFAALAGGPVRLMTMPGQYRTDWPEPETGVWRRFGELTFRLYFSGNTTVYANDFTDAIVPATAAAPTLIRHAAESEDGRIRFSAQVTGHPAAGIQQVWITYTSDNPSDGWYGRWRSLDLTQDEADTLLWTGTLDLQGNDPADVRYMIQAVNGVGLVSLLTNQGRYYTPDQDPTYGAGDLEQAATELRLENAPAAAAYSDRIEATARLTSNGEPLAGELVRLSLADQSRSAVTDAEGRARFTMTVLGLPGENTLALSYAGRNAYAPADVSQPLRITRQTTALTLEVTPPAEDSGDSYPNVTAILTAGNGRPLGEKTVVFAISGNGDPRYVALITDPTGRVTLDQAFWLSLPPSAYRVEARFGQVVAVAEGIRIDLEDVRFEGADAVANVEIQVGADGQRLWLPLIQNR